MSIEYLNAQDTMASRFDNTQSSHPLDEVGKLIEVAFERLFQIVLRRKIELLSRLNEYRVEYDNLLSDRIKNEKDLATLKQQIEKLNSNDFMTMQQNFLDEIEEKLCKLNLSALGFELNFRIDTVEVEEGIKKLGRITKATEAILPNYSSMKMPIVATRKKGDNSKVLTPSGIAFEEETNSIFVCDFDSSCIKIFSITGEFIEEFGHNDLLHPTSILLYRSFIYITDFELFSVLKFNRPNYKFPKRVGRKGSGNGEFDKPCRLAVGPDGNLFLAESVNDRISILDTELHFKRHIKHKKMERPVDIKFYRDQMVVLCSRSSNIVQLFGIDGDYIKCLISIENGLETGFFCLDAVGNILISNFTNHNILVYDKNGVLLHTIGKFGQNTGEFYYTYGIATTRSGRLIVASRNENYGLQIF